MPRRGTARNVASFLEENHRLRTKKERLESRLEELRTEIETIEDQLDEVNAEIEVHESVWARHLLHSASISPCADRLQQLDGFKMPSLPMRGQDRKSTRPTVNSRASPKLGTKLKGSPHALITPASTEHLGSYDSEDESEEQQHAHKAGTQRKLLTPSIFSKHNPTVVDLDGAWTEIWCHICGANSSDARNEYFLGVPGLLRHYTKKHKGLQEHYTWKDVVAVCGRHALTEQQISDVTRGAKIFGHRQAEMSKEQEQNLQDDPSQESEDAGDEKPEDEAVTTVEESDCAETESAENTAQETSGEKSPTTHTRSALENALEAFRAGTLGDSSSGSGKKRSRYAVIDEEDEEEEGEHATSLAPIRRPEKRIRAADSH